MRANTNTNAGGNNTNLTDELERAEGLLLQGEGERARELLARLAEDAEEYVAANCPTTDELQWFAFPTLFERLAYRRVEDDPRELRDVGEPFDRLYADLALADVHVGDYAHATEALKRAVRWNPMGCEHRLNLADLFRNAGNVREYLALTYSVFERASDAAHLERAFVNFAEWFAAEGKPQAAGAALAAARRLGAGGERLAAVLEQASGTLADPDALDDVEVAQLLATEGLPEGANAEVAVCLLMCASDAAAVGDRNTATRLTVRARDLVGEDAAMALLALIHESGAGAGGAGAGAGGSAGADGAAAGGAAAGAGGDTGAAAGVGGDMNAGASGADGAGGGAGGCAAAGADGAGAGDGGADGAGSGGADDTGDGAGGCAAAGADGAGAGDGGADGAGSGGSAGADGAGGAAAGAGGCAAAGAGGAAAGTGTNEGGNGHVQG